MTEDVTHTLRAQDKGHPPLVLDSPMSAGGFCTEHSADSRGIGYEDEKAPTLRANVVPGVAIEYNPTDSRIKVKEDGICQTLCARCGTGGNNVPLTMQPFAYGICADQSGGMLSERPKVGYYEVETNRTPDSRPDPTLYQDNNTVVEEKPAYALTCGSFMDFHKEFSPTLLARDYKDPPLVGEASEVEYLVRRLTPDECCRLQGYPDGWCKNVEIPWPTEEDITFWTHVFQEHKEVTGSKSKPKTRRQIIQWLIRPGTDSAEYKAYGNSVAVPCVFFILAGIVWANENNNPNEGDKT